MSVVFLVSDFMTDDDVLGSRELAHLAARHDVIAVVPEDPSERELPAGRGYLQVRDVESGRQVARRPRPTGARRVTPRRRAAARRADARVLPGADGSRVRADRRSPVEPLLSLFAKRMNA